MKPVFDHKKKVKPVAETRQVRIQAKLAINQPGDSYEQEADAMAEKVMRQRATGPVTGLIAPSLQRKCAACEEEEEKKKKGTIMRKAEGSGGISAAPTLASQLGRAGSGGAPLPEGARNFMESSFRTDFSGVRIHADSQAAEMSRGIHARAFTYGKDIYFNSGQYTPDAAEGKRLLAHELTHVVQQSATDKRISRKPVATKPVATETFYDVDFPDGKRRVTAEEYERLKQQAINNLRNKLKLAKDLADYGRQTQVNTLKDYQGGVESLSDVILKPKSLIGIFSDIRAGVTPPYLGMWNNAKHDADQGIAELDKGNLAGAARLLSLSETDYKNSLHEWNAYREATIGGAEKIVDNLETVRDVSFAIALAAGAAVVAPVIAGVAGAGALGTAVTALGTATVVGTGGAALGGGSTALGSYVSDGKVDYAATKRDAIKFGKQGVVTGLTAGLGTALAGTGKAAELARPFVQQALRRCLTDAGVNIAGDITTSALDKLIPGEKKDEKEQPAAATDHKPLLPGPVRSVITGCVSGALGVSVNKIGSGVVKKGTETAIGVGVAYGDTRLSGASNKEALAAAGQATLTSAVLGAAKQPVKKGPATKKAPREEVKPATKKAPGEEVKPAVKKEDAIAKKSLGDGHEVVVTKQGVAKCSPSPCPVIHVEYRKELEKYPELRKRNEEIQALRKTDPARAASEAEALVKTLEAERHNQARGHQGGEELDFGLDIGERRARQIQEGKKDFRLDHALTFDIDEVLPVGGKGIKPQRAVKRALDPANRQLLDPQTNRGSKGLGIDPRELASNRPARPPESLTGPNKESLLLTRRFSEVTELKVIFDEAVKKVDYRSIDKPTKIKAAVNSEVRRIIKEGTSPEAIAVREALQKLNFEYIEGKGFTQINRPIENKKDQTR